MYIKYLKKTAGQWTKLMLTFLVGSLLLTACSKDDKVEPLVISFEQETAGIPLSGEVAINIVASRTATENITVPVVLSGSAVKGTDYTVSAEAATIVAGTNKATITIKTKNSFGRDKNIRIDLGTIPPNAQRGTISSVVVGIEDGSVLIYSFAAQTNTMTETAEVTLQLKTISGNYTAEKELRIPIELGAGSTATEGTHFSFEGAKEVVIPVGKSSGTIKLKYLKQEAGKDVIELKLGAVNSHFVAGNYEKTKVMIFGPLYTQLVGTWKYKAFTNLDWWIEGMSGMGDDLTLMPKNNTEADQLIFAETGLQVNMQGVLKNYFRNSELTYVGEIDERLQEAGGIRPPVVKIVLVKAKANVAFSATTVKERLAEVGFRTFKESGKDILEVTIRDFEPVDFLTETYAMYTLFGDVPVMKTMPLRYHFEKVN
ncbi:MAG: hypothetical protein P0Y53_17315 [Candidatus Pseudobacter hemicellulosilyticus]|uniref:Calx-beta domain-containing protein n=1 Tax=Candidatus Pseudobacter hemicellulosilyticus TaxID=3121375 RepID=A0AAJ6BFZ8_9BACT|nr:MAG: hypothetical protein P0Y53_17315 [Pseudobacter sp.]